MMYAAPRHRVNQVVTAKPQLRRPAPAAPRGGSRPQLAALHRSTVRQSARIRTRHPSPSLILPAATGQSVPSFCVYFSVDGEYACWWHVQAQQRRILQLEGEVEALRVEAGRQQEAIIQQRGQTRAAEARIQELQQELDNNAGACGKSQQQQLQRSLQP